MAMRNPCPTVVTDPWTRRIAPARGEGGFLGGKPPKGAHWHGWCSLVTLITAGIMPSLAKFVFRTVATRFASKGATEGPALEQNLYIYRGTVTIYGGRRTLQVSQQV